MSRSAPEGLALPTVDRASPTPLYRQVYEGYRTAIAERRLRGGDRLPSTRALATELGISRLPILNAFEQLIAEGYCESRSGSGTFVARDLPDERLAAVAAPPPPAAGSGAERIVSAAAAALTRPPVPWLANRGAFCLGEIALAEFPLRAWSALMARHARELAPAQLHYGDVMGHPPLREAIASYLRSSRSVRCEADQIMVTSGSQQAINIAIRALLDPGDPVWIEEPGYWGSRNALIAAGATIVPVPVDAEGLDVRLGVELAPRARVAFVTPTHQNPLGSTMTARRRLQLLAWARRQGAWILEDDYDSEFRFEVHPVAALQGLDRDARVVYIGTFSKIVFPAVRVAYLVIPRDLVPSFVAIRRSIDICPPISTQAVLADFLAEGRFARHLRRMRVLYGERRRVLVDRLRRELDGRYEIVGEQAGTHVVLLLPPGMRDRELCERAAAEGLWLMPLSDRYHGRPERQGFVLGYGGTPAAAIPAAVRRLRDLLAAAGG